MTQVVGVIGGKNKSKDYHFQHTASALIETGVVSGLEVTVDSVSIGSSFIEVARTGGATFKVPFFSSEVEAITTGINQKIFIEIGQTNIDDGDLNNSVDGTGIGTITVAASFPSGNYIPLASSNGAGAITDLRVFIEYKKALQNLDGISGDINTSGDITGAFLYGDGSNLTGLSAEVSSTSLNYMLGGTGTVGKGYSLNPYEQLSVGTSNDFGSVAQPEVAQSFYAQDVDIVTLKLNIKKVSAPSDNILLEIQTDNAGVPSGTPVTNGTSNNVAGTGLTTSFVETTFTFASVPTLTAETLYHIVVKRSGATDAVNYYGVESAGSSVQIGTASLNTGTWANTTDDLYFVMQTGYELITLGGTNFVGVLQLVGTEGQIRKVNKDYDDNQTGLVAGNYYGYNVVTGTIESGTDFKAISTTKLDLKNRKKLNKFGGNGSDGAISGALTITGSNDTVITKNYTDFTPGSNTVTITPTNCLLHIKVSGNCDLTDTTFNFNGKGGVGGTGGLGNANYIGNDGTSGNNGITILGSNKASGGTFGGAGIWTDGRGAGGDGGVNLNPFLNSIDISKMVLLYGGGGGAGGGSGAQASVGQDGGTGGNGGGVVFLEVAGDLIFSSSTMNFNGDNGVNGDNSANGGAGGGGGGGGGLFICLYNGTLSGTNTPTISGGTGGTKGAGGSFYGGGGGGGGAGVIGDGTAGDNALLDDGGNGGVGGNGTYVIQQNNTF